MARTRNWQPRINVPTTYYNLKFCHHMYILKGPQQEIAYNLAIFKGVHLTCILKSLSSKKLMDSLISTDHSYRRWMSRWMALQGNRGLSSLCGETVTAENFRTFFSRTAKITRRTAKTHLQQKGAQSLLQDNFFPCEKLEIIIKLGYQGD